MEWVETTGRTVDEAKDAALDQLGVAEDDAEFQVLEEPRPGLFGRVRGEARVRARVRPTQPRPKEDRRDRRRRARGDGNGRGEGRGEAAAVSPGSTTSDAGTGGGESGRSGGGESGRSGGGRGGRDGRRRERSGGSPTSVQAEAEEASVMREDDETLEDVPLSEQGEEAADFVRGLLERFELDGEVSAEVLDDENVEVRVSGADLGILIGPKGATLGAVQELARTVVQRRLRARHGRILVDVSGYRQKRKQALERFTHDVAAQVKSSGQRKVLEPMSPADRKIVHDTVNTIEGVSTTSEGEEPRRRVVILPQG